MVELWARNTVCMWLLGSVIPLEEGAALDKAGKLLILYLEDHTLFSVGFSSNQYISSPVLNCT